MNFEVQNEKSSTQSKRQRFQRSISRSISFNELVGGANDIVVVNDDDGEYKSTPLNIVIGKMSSKKTIINSRRKGKGILFVNGHQVLSETKFRIGKSGLVYIKRHFNSVSYSFGSEEISQMQLQTGRNETRFSIEDLGIDVSFSIYLFTNDTKFIVSDIDGTITRSDVRGFVGGKFGFEVHHLDVVRFLHNANVNGYQILYLTARPVAFDEGTREYLFDNLNNSDGGYKLPFGPLFLSSVPTDRLGHTDPNIIKTSVLNSVLSIFKCKEDVILGAFGNKQTDTVAYSNVGIPLDRIFILNKDSQISNVGTRKIYSYSELANKVNELFPSRIKMFSI